MALGHDGPEPDREKEGSWFPERSCDHMAPRADDGHGQKHGRPSVGLGCLSLHLANALRQVFEPGPEPGDSAMRSPPTTEPEALPAFEHHTCPLPTLWAEI